MDGDARVASGEDVLHHLLVEDRVGGHGEDVLHGRHDAANGLGLEVEDGGDDGDFVFVEALLGVTERLVQSDEALEAGLLVRGAVIFAEEVVKQLRSGPGDGGHDPHEAEHHGRAPGAYGQAIADADGLGNDFAKDD